MATYTYVLKFETTGGFYIGSTIDLKKRFANHLSQARSGRHQNVNVQEHWKIDQDLKISEIYVHDTIEAARSHEEELIRVNLDNPLLLNIGLSAMGGDNLTRHPDRDRIVKIISKHVTEYKADLKRNDPEMYKVKYSDKVAGKNNPMYGKTHTEESRAKISKAITGIPSPFKGVPMGKERLAQHRAVMKKVDRTGENNSFYGKKHSQSSLQKMRSWKRKPKIGKCVEIDGVVYMSYSAAGRAHGIDLTTVRHRCRSKNPKMSNYKLLQECPTTIESYVSKDINDTGIESSGPQKG